jgi:hypothetical protein
MERFEKLNQQGKLRPHFNLNVWKKSIDLVKTVYALTNSFPNEEKFGIISQIRRATVSVPTNKEQEELVKKNSFGF